MYHKSVGSQGAGAYPSGHRAIGGVHPGQVSARDSPEKIICFDNFNYNKINILL